MWDLRISESDTTMIEYMRGTVLRKIPLKIGLRIDKKFNIKYPLIPKRDWNYFLSQIDSLKILQLPTQKSIPKYEETPVLDGDWYTIEIKNTDGTIRKLDYSNPTYDKPDYWESKNVVRFIDILHNDFKLKK